MAGAARSVCEHHSFLDIEELTVVRSNLLAWYDDQKRELPWRTLVCVLFYINISRTAKLEASMLEEVCEVIRGNEIHV